MSKELMDPKLDFILKHYPVNLANYEDIFLNCRPELQLTEDVKLPGEYAVWTKTDDSTSLITVDFVAEEDFESFMEFFKAYNEQNQEINTQNNLLSYSLNPLIFLGALMSINMPILAIPTAGLYGMKKFMLSTNNNRLEELYAELKRKELGLLGGNEALNRTIGIFEKGKSDFVCSTLEKTLISISRDEIEARELAIVAYQRGVYLDEERIMEANNFVLRKPERLKKVNFVHNLTYVL